MDVVLLSYLHEVLIIMTWAGSGNYLLQDGLLWEQLLGYCCILRNFCVAESSFWVKEGFESGHFYRTIDCSDWDSSTTKLNFFIIYN